MIEIRKTKEGTNKEPATHAVFIDDNLIDGVLVQTGFDDDEPFAIVTSSPHATEKLIVYSYAELRNLGPITFKFDYSVEWNEAIGQLWFLAPEEETYSVYLFFSSIDHWHRTYSFDTYYTTLRQHITDAGVTDISVEDPLSGGDLGIHVPFAVFAIGFSGLSKTSPIASELNSRLDVLRSFHQSVLDDLESRFPTDKVEVFFDFPEVVRVPCEQYLLYFTQFLKDLGVEATADLRHEAGKVLFSVLPGNKETALDNIRAALDTYLQLPSSPVNEDSIHGIEEQRLAANVDHLKGQLRLANATIKTQQVTINLLENEIRVGDSAADERQVQLFGGIVTLGKLNKYGVEVDYSEIFRRLRQLLGTDS